MTELIEQARRPFEEWQTRYAATNAAIHDLLQRVTEVPEAVAEVIDYAHESAGMESLRKEAESTLCHAIQVGATCAAAAFAAICYSEGKVSFTLDQQTREFAARGTISSTHPASWLKGFCFASIAHDTNALAILCREQTIQRSLQSAYQVADFWKPLMVCLCALEDNDPAKFAQWLDQTRRDLQSLRLDPQDREIIEATISPALALAACLIAKDVGAWNQTLAAALDAHAAYWGSEQNRYNPEGFLALELLALCAMADVRGIKTTVRSPYLPTSLMQGECAQSSTITYHFPRKSARSVDEAHLFMALQGCSAAACTHQLEADNDQLIATYLCQPVAPGEQFAFEFLLSEENMEATAGSAWQIGGDQPSTLLDAGEFLWLADQTAQQVPASTQNLSPEALQQRNQNLKKALACLDEVLKFIPANAEEVPNSGFWTEFSRQLREEEPGRFQRARLEAIRQAWQTLLTEPAAKAAEANPELDARSRTLLALETIKEQLRPLLELLPSLSPAELAQQLYPRPDDYGKVFEQIDLAWLSNQYAQLWSGGIELKLAADQRVLEIHAAPAGMLQDENELSLHFPGGYHKAADYLNPHRIWVAWKYLRPGASAGMAFDGLVWVDDHWAWFPKPYRLIGQWLTKTQE